jgi:hypothetical protein
MGSLNLDEETRKELRRKKFCFSCHDLWVPGHKCVRKHKTKRLIILRSIRTVIVMMRKSSVNKNRDTRHQVRRHHRLGLRALLWHPCQDFPGTTLSSLRSPAGAQGYNVD